MKIPGALEAPGIVLSMDITLTVQIIKYLVTVLAGVILGNGAVYLFNHMPASWFFDYGEMPPEPDDDAREGAKA